MLWTAATFCAHAPVVSKALLRRNPGRIVDYTQMRHIVTLNFRRIIGSHQLSAGLRMTHHAAFAVSQYTNVNLVTKDSSSMAIVAGNRALVPYPAAWAGDAIFVEPFGDMRWAEA